MRIQISILFILCSALLTRGQEFRNNGDKYFYAYAYEEAIKEYQKQMQRGAIMTNHQFLNLADSYFITKDYTKAVKLYLDIYKNDTIMSDSRFNKMLQGLAKVSEPERVKAFLKSKSGSLANELIENAAFNFELLESEVSDPDSYTVFDIGGNSPQADFAPSFYRDKLLFSSSRKAKSKKVYGPTGESYIDIYVSAIGNSGRALNPNPFEGVPPSKFHKATPHYSEEFDRLFYVLSNEKDGELAFNEKGKNALAIGMSYDNGFFRFLLKDLGTSFYYPFYHESSGRLYFAADFPDGYGGTDLYYVETNNLQIMSEPINLGPRINTPGNEIAPYFLEDSFYFSSDIFYGLGGMDVYKSILQSDGSYSTPINLGKGINSPADDFGFILRSTESGGFRGYFSSNRKGGMGNDDIYGFRTEKSPGLKTLLFRGTIVQSKTDDGIPDVSVQLLDGKGALIKEVYSRADGSYQLEVPYRDGVSLKMTKPKHSRFYETYTAESLEKIQQGPLNIGLAVLSELIEEKEGKTVLKIDNFVFAKGKSQITGTIAGELDKVAQTMKAFPKLQLRIETHTDSRGSTTTNKRLSQSRATAIQQYLRSQGVAAQNILRATGYGEQKILNNCTNGVYCLDFLHAQNARTLFVVENLEVLEQ
ncbi:OmpA family protein [Maribacter sp. 2-571]|uniref:OmpA family protein n=1 Tax=Maribacter sp. 2-571 TaxID=3417569 RepID=UPI003D352434